MSAPRPNDPISIFRKSMSPEFLAHSLERLTKAYARAYDYVNGAFQKPEAHDLVGYHTRAIFEGSWRTLQHDPVHHASGVTGRVEKNRRRTASFTVMQCGIVSMTASAVPNRKEIVRNATFRNVFAAVQGELFDKDEPREITQVYGILLHGRQSWDNPGVIGFAEVAFPICDRSTKLITGYYPVRIDLLAEYGSIVRATEGVAEEKVLDTLQVELKRQRQKGIG